MHGNSGWPVSTITDGVPDIENITDALQNGPYGTCVYESPNDVCDQQVISLYCIVGSGADTVISGGQPRIFQWGDR